MKGFTPGAKRPCAKAARDRTRQNGSLEVTGINYRSFDPRRGGSRLRFTHRLLGALQSGPEFWVCFGKRHGGCFDVLLFGFEVAANLFLVTQVKRNGAVDLRQSQKRVLFLDRFR